MNRNYRSIIFALLLILLAVSLILWKLNVFNLPVAFAGVGPWGLIVSVIMIIAIINGIMDLNFGSIFVPLAVIAIIFDDALGITALTPWTVMIVAFLLTVAFGMLFPNHGHYHGYRGYRRERHGRRGEFSNRFTETYDEGENGYVMHSMRFGSATKYIRSKNLMRADLSSSFGEMSVFFDGAVPQEKKVTIDCHVAFGQMNIFIPKEWKIINKVAVTLGDCQDRASVGDFTDDAPECVITGSVSFGELQINRV
jgi:hypothetical protein